MTTTRRLILASPLLLVLGLGCGPTNQNTSVISGKITYNGNPVTAGTITFQPEQGPSFTRPISADGTYTNTDMPTGEFKVTIETESANPDRKTPTYGQGNQTSSPAPGGAPPGGTVTQGPAAGGGKYVKIPAKYADAKTSGLTVNVAAGKQTKDFPLTD